MRPQHSGKWLGMLLSGQLLIVPVQAEEAPEAAPAEDELTIRVTAPRLSRDLYETPAAVSVINGPEIRQGHQRLQLDESLNTVPGLFFQNRYNFAQNLRLSTRGFGARSPFGIRGIQIRVDGIPYTLPDGQAQVDAIDLDSAERIEVIRGPSSVQYGNAAGGVIAVTTARGYERPNGARLKLDAGSDRYRKGTIQANGSEGPMSGSATLSWLDYEGYRDQSEVEKALFNGRLEHEWQEGQTLTATFNAVDTPKAQDPGGLTQAQVDEDRTQATNFANRLDSGQNLDQQTLGLIYRDPTVGPGTLTTSTFFSRRDFEQQLPFPGPSLIAFDRQFYGASSQYEHQAELAGKPLNYAFGIDVNRQEDDRRRYSVAASGQVTGQTQEEDQTATATGVFAQGDLALTPKLSASLGLRYDHLRLAVDDQRTSDGDDSGSRTYREVSGMAGLSYRIAAQQQVYATVGTAFESPTFTEFANPDGSGGFNPDIEPQEALNRELGVRGTLGPSITYDLAIFSIEVDNEIVPFDRGGQTFYENAGQTEREGVELGVNWTPSYAWSVTSALTLADYTLQDFTDEQGNNANGNKLPGLPSEQWVNEVKWRGQAGRFAALETQYVGDVFAENSNQTEVDAYWLVSLRAGTDFRFGEQTLGVYAGIRNLFDEDYFSNLRINANTDRPVEQRGYFEPAPGRTINMGVNWQF
ncbi:MAG: TonB-dependent receptor [Marinobacter sp.]|uniref:TonB-dependent receptor family protein n=1 Tax=Marinobacter sp. TaxID=50741 RepID=UPI00349FED57